MQIPQEFDAIRPYTPEELPRVFDELLADAQFVSVARSLMGDMPEEVLRAQLRSCPTNLDVQKAFFYPLLKKLLAKCSTSCDLDAAALPEHSANYTFISNHRDIVLDSALLCILLLDNGFSTTVEIAIGDNLLIYPWIEKLVRVNKSFIVRRSVGIREMLQASALMSRYMHFAVAEKHENIWIAQREGRAKDSNDRTQESVLKMMAMGGEGTPAERLASLHIVPLAISYEYDPCDYLKAREFQQRRDDAHFQKSRQDDLESMQTGIFGFKGCIHYAAAPCINEWLPEVAELPKAQFFAEVARRIDREIHRRYRLYPINYVAADLLHGDRAFAAHYTAAEAEAAERYFAERVGMVQLPAPDARFLREQLLVMYANPVVNQQAAL